MMTSQQTAEIINADYWEVFILGRKIKYDKKFKLYVVQRYLNGEGSSYVLGKELGISSANIRTWVKMFNLSGEKTFESHEKNSNTYTKEFKEKVVLEYLNGYKTLLELTLKYNIPGESTILRWVKDYNSHIELKDYIPGGKEIYMTKSRKVSKEERIEIVKYCMDHNLETKRNFMMLRRKLMKMKNSDVN